VTASVLPDLAAGAALPSALEFERAAIAAGLRADVSAEGSLGARIRDASRRKVPYVAVIGEREASSGSASLRPRGGGSLPMLPFADALGVVASAVARLE
jgi:threonyl-tRNA synthetase